MSELEIKPKNYYLDVLQNPDYYLTKEKPIYKKVIKEAYSREQVLKLLEPQLTIPKSIADMLDAELNPLERESMLETFVLGINYLVLSDELMKFVLTGNNYHIISAYLAGKALGVDLVKVGEG